MPKLYVEPNGAWTVPGEQSKAATRADVPNAPADLAAWLNARGIAADAQPAPPSDTPAAQQLKIPVCPYCKRTHDDAVRVAALTDRSAILGALEDHILRGDTWLISRLLDVTIARLGELKRELKS